MFGAENINFSSEYFLFTQEHGIQSIKVYNNLQENVLNWKGNDSTITGKELFDKATYSVEDIVAQIDIRLDTDNQNGSHRIKLNGDELKNNLFAENGHGKYGKCYAYHPTKYIRDLGVYYIKIKM